MSEKKWTIREILDWTTGAFKERGFPTPRLDAQLLLSAALSLPKIALYTQVEKPLSTAERDHVRALVRRRLSGEPVAYILNRKDWHDLDLYVDARVLIPRPETESLLDVALETTRARGLEPRVIYDLCTGSGCLAIALKKRFPSAEVIGVDVSEAALEVARLNAERNGTPDVQFLLADLELGSTYDYLRRVFGAAQIIVANPPYVAESEWQELDPSVKSFEPKGALVAAEDGLFLARAIVSNVLRASLLDGRDGALFLMEQGVGHPRQVMDSMAGTPESSERPGASAADVGLATLRPAATGRVHAVSGASSREYPVNDFFALRDLAGRERFLALLWKEDGVLRGRSENAGDGDVAEEQANSAEEVSEETTPESAEVQLGSDL